jgi:hypothetical protein
MGPSLNLRLTSKEGAGYAVSNEMYLIVDDGRSEAVNFKLCFQRNKEEHFALALVMLSSFIWTSSKVEAPSRTDVKKQSIAYSFIL